MSKKEAVRRMIDEFSAIPTEWVKIIAEHEGNYPNLPMWRTMWIVDDMIGQRLMQNAAEVRPCAEHTDDYDADCEECASYNEELEGAYRIAGTAAYLYEVDDQYVLGVHGAGWDFFEGVWEPLYDLLGLQWHDEERIPTVLHSLIHA